MLSDAVVSAIDSSITTPFGWVCILILNDRWRFERKIIRYLSFVYILLLLIADAYFFTANGTTISSKSTVSIFNICSCFVVYLLLSPGLDGCTLFVFFSACIVIFISDTVSDFFIPASVAGHLLLKLFSFVILLILLIWFFRKPFKAVIGEINQYWFIISMLPLCICHTFAFLIMVPGPLYQNPQFRMPAMFLCMTSLFSYAGLYLVFRVMWQRSQIQDNYIRLQTHIKLIQEHTSQLEKLYGKIHMYRHDMRHFTQIQMSCLEKGDIENAKRALGMLDDSILHAEESRVIRDYTANVLLDSVLSYYESIAHTMDVSVVIRMETPSLGCDEEAFCVMMSNALENAVHACGEIPQGAPRYIRVNGKSENHKYYLEIVNSCDGKVCFDEKMNPVSHAQGHGWGTKSIRAFVEKRGGVVQYKLEGSDFYLRVIF